MVRFAPKSTTPGLDLQYLTFAQNVRRGGRGVPSTTLLRFIAFSDWTARDLRSYLRRALALPRSPRRDHTALPLLHRDDIVYRITTGHEGGWNRQGKVGRKPKLDPDGRECAFARRMAGEPSCGIAEIALVVNHLATQSTLLPKPSPFPA